MKSDLPLVVLGLGSNLGDSRRIILEAVKVLESVLTDLRAASLYETEPLHVTDQNRFINTAVAGFYNNSPRELLTEINRIEAQFGRDRKNERRWGERLLDIDILLFGDLIINEADLQIPHPRLKERRFALEPLLELLPDAQESATGISYRSICNKVSYQNAIKLI